jgi:hypothetical protein
MSATSVLVAKKSIHKALDRCQDMPQKKKKKKMIH